MKKEVLRQHLAELEDRYGRLTAETVVSAATDPDHPLHEHFDWDDKSAAHKHRLDHARFLIRSVKLEVTVQEHVVEVPSYARDPEQKPLVAGYRNVKQLKDDEDLRREALVNEFAQAAAVLKRARNLAVYFEATDDVDRLIDGLNVLSSKFEGEAGHA